MAERLYDEIPSLDLADFTSGNPARKAQFVKDLGDAYENIGFVAIKNHGLTDELQDKLYATVKKFFALPQEVKQKYEFEELQGQRGYIGRGKEQAKGFDTPDLKEFFHVGQECTDEEAATDSELRSYPRNVWVEELPELQQVTVEVYRTLEAAGVNMLRAIALHLGLAENYFDAKIKNGNSILRPIYYYPLDPETTDPKAVRAAEHGDINLITLLMGASADGLQVLRKDGKWIGVTSLPKQVVVNVGDMLDRHTNHRLKSTIHRVVNPPKEKMNTERFSIPFFMHPRSEMDLTCLESCISEENPKRYEDISAGDFLAERLAEIGFGKKK